MSSIKILLHLVNPSKQRFELCFFIKMCSSRAIKSLRTPALWKWQNEVDKERKNVEHNYQELGHSSYAISQRQRAVVYLYGYRYEKIKSDETLWSFEPRDFLSFTSFFSLMVRLYKRVTFQCRCQPDEATGKRITFFPLCTQKRYLLCSTCSENIKGIQKSRIAISFLQECEFSLIIRKKIERKDSILIKRENFLKC